MQVDDADVYAAVTRGSVHDPFDCTYSALFLLHLLIQFHWLDLLFKHNTYPYS